MTLLEGIEKFFNPIKQKCFSKEEYAAELLKARGFLLEDNELALSDNSFFAKNRWTREIIDSPVNDANYLNELLKDQNIGKVQGNKIIIFPNTNVEKIFYSSIQLGVNLFLPMKCHSFAMIMLQKSLCGCWKNLLQDMLKPFLLVEYKLMVLMTEIIIVRDTEGFASKFQV